MTLNSDPRSTRPGDRSLRLGAKVPGEGAESEGALAKSPLRAPLSLREEAAHSAQPNPSSALPTARAHGEEGTRPTLRPDAQIQPGAVSSPASPQPSTLTTPSQAKVTDSVHETPSAPKAEDVARGVEQKLDALGAALPTGGPDMTGTHQTQQLSPRHQLEAWLAAMIKNGSSDLILRASGRPSCRVHGRIEFLEGRVPHAGALMEVIGGIIGPARMNVWREEGSVDVGLQLDGLGRFRLNAYKQMGEPALVLRRISDSPPSLDTLCLPTAELRQLALRKRGILLVTGIAGSGKSTTLAGMIEHMNHHAERHVITLEDPVEMIFTEDRCVISQREIGTDVPTFHEGLRHSLRQSPDVILIGEMRDAETVRAALDATETGHLVMSTVHTVNAAQTVDRIVSFFPPEQHSQVRSRLADNIVGVLSQRLVARGGDKGLVPAVELMVSTPHMRELVSEGRTQELSTVIDQGNEAGMISFNLSLRRLILAGLIDVETALAASDRPDELRLALRGFTTAGQGPNGAPGAPGTAPTPEMQRTSTATPAPGLARRETDPGHGGASPGGLRR